MNAAVIWAGIGGLWRPGPLALAVSWYVAQIYWLATGVNVPVTLYRVLDLAVIAAFFTQARGVLDWMIIALFPVEWGFYGVAEPLRWWTLWGLCLFQMMLAGPWLQIQRIAPLVSHGPLRAGVRR